MTNWETAINTSGILYYAMPIEALPGIALIGSIILVLIYIIIRFPNGGR